MATAIHQRGLQRYAGGGFISSLFGASKPETATEKFARQDAEFKAKHPERFQPQLPASTPPSGVGGVKGMVEGSLANSLKEREKAAGLKNGGAVRKKCVEGGEIEGPGGPTDDLVPIDASNGEFMIKASSAKILGPEVLEALNDLGDEPKDSKADAVEDANEKEGMKCGGAVRKKMADGGPVEMPMNTTPMNEQDQQAFNSLQSTATGIAPAVALATMTTQPAEPQKQLRASTTSALNSYTPLPIPKLKAGGMVRQPKRMAGGGWTQDNQAELDKRVAQIPAGGMAPAPDGLSMGNDFTRNANNSLNALGGMGVVASVPLKAAAAVPSGLGAIRNAANAAPMLSNGVKSADFIAGASGVAKVGGANLPTVINNAGPVAKTTNVALQEGAKANQMAAGVRSFGNASAGAGMLDGQQLNPLEQVPQVQGSAPAQPATAPQAPSLSAPWYSPEYARAANASDLGGLELERARRANVSPGDANDPLKTMLQNGTVGATSPTAASPATTTTTVKPVNARGQGYSDPRLAGVGQAAAAPADDFSNAAIAKRNPGGMVRKVGNSYSGSNITGDVSFQGADGNALPGRPGGGSMTYGGMSPEAIKSALTNPDGSAWSAGDNAIMAANIRDGVDKYRGTSRDARNDPMNQPMTKDQRAARVRMAEVNSQDKRYAQTDAREQAQLGMNREEHTAKMTAQKQLADAQAEYLAAGDDPVKLKAAERKLITLGGKQPAAVRAFAVPGGQGVNADGTPYTIASSVYDPDTKQFIQQGGPQGAQAQQQGSSSVAAPTSQAEYDKLPKGARYTHPDGTTRTKG